MSDLLPAAPAAKLPENPAPAGPASPKQTAGTKPGLAALGIRIAVIAGIIAVALYCYVPGLYEQETDDAYITAHVVTVMPKIPAYVKTLYIDDNASVSAGALLLQLDPRDYQNAVNGAVADLSAAQADWDNVNAELAEQQTLIAQAQAALLSDQAEVTFEGQELRRYATLVRQSDAPLQQLQQTQSDIVQKQSNLQRDEAALAQAKAHVAVLQAQRTQAQSMIARQQAGLAQARLNLSYTRITATVAGTIANKSVEVGDFVQPGQALFSLVPSQPYVIANYKETQLTHMHPGQPVRIFVDGFPNLRLQGHVDSIQRGTGSIFELLPPENATGNFVKVVQRIPVKIVFDTPAQAYQILSPGMSVETDVRIAARPAWLDWF